jgi:DUF4097 and DUF4098 domain-containing protein YvlB
VTDGRPRNSKEHLVMVNAITRPPVRSSAIPILVIALTLVLPALSSAQTAQGSFERTLTVSGPVDMDVATGSGDVTVRPGPAGSVKVIGHIRANSAWLSSGRAPAEKVKAIEAKPPIEQTGNTIRIGRMEDRDLQQNVSISYEITAPTQCTLRSRTGSGDQNVGDISGPVDVSSGSGSIVLATIGGRVDAATGSGDITTGAVRGALSARTGSGSVRAGGVSGELVVSTGSGDIQVSQTATGSVRVSAASGDVKLTGIQGPLRVDSASGDISVQGAPSGEWQVSSASGDVTLVLPQTAGFELDARSSSGSIESKHPVTMTGTLERHVLMGKVRGGGASVKVRTSSGDIRIQ